MVKTLSRLVVVRRDDTIPVIDADGESIRAHVVGKLGNDVIARIDKSSELFILTGVQFEGE